MSLAIIIAAGVAAFVGAVVIVSVWSLLPSAGDERFPWPEGGPWP